MPFVNDMLAEQNPTPPRPRTAPGRYTFDVTTIVAQLRRHIVGQEAAIRDIEETLTLVRAELGEEERPLAVCLLLGPTGVGKTEMVRLLAQAIHGEADAFCRVDMSTLSQEHYASALTGAPPGYVGSREGNTVLDEDRIRGSFSKPGICLFDELEKASPEVLQALLGVFDRGRMRIASGEREIDFRNTLIFMTSNLGARDIQRHASRRRHLPTWLWRPRRQQRHLRALVERRLEASFSPEFVNRIDRLTLFNWLEAEVLNDLAMLEIARLNRRLQRHDCSLEVDAAALAFLARRGFDRRYGARALKRAVRGHLELLVAKQLLQPTPDGRRVPQIWQVRLQGDTLSIEPRPAERTSPRNSSSA